MVTSAACSLRVLVLAGLASFSGGCAVEDVEPEAEATADEIVGGRTGDVVSWNLCGAAKDCDNGDWPARSRRQLDEVRRLAAQGVRVIGLTEFCSGWEQSYADALRSAGYTVAMQRMTRPDGAPVDCRAGLGQQSNFLAVKGNGTKSVERFFPDRASENRGFMCIDVGDFRGCVTHLENAKAGVRNAQRRSAKTWGETDGRRTIIAGDFNEKDDRDDDRWMQLWVSRNYGCGLDWALIERAHFDRAAETTRVRADTDHGSCYARGNFRER